MESSLIKTQKSLLRRRLRKALSRLTKTERVRKSRRILGKLMRMTCFKRARKIFTYMALPEEVQTEELILEALGQRKRIFLPSINARTREISIFEIWNPKKDLRKGRYGILEPIKKRRGRPENLDLVVVPGLGFDLRGARLGRGEGYFDRFLKRTRHAKKMALAYREQIVKKIPTLPHDISMDAVITD